MPPKRVALTIETSDAPSGAAVPATMSLPRSRRTLRFRTAGATAGDLEAVGVRKKKDGEEGDRGKGKGGDGGDAAFRRPAAGMTRFVTSTQSFVYAPSDWRCLANGDVSHEVDSLIHTADSIARMLVATFMAIDAGTASVADVKRLALVPAAVSGHIPHCATFPDVTGTYVYDAVVCAYGDGAELDAFRAAGLTLPHRSAKDYATQDASVAPLLKYTEETDTRALGALRARCRVAMPTMFADGVAETMPTWNLIVQRRHDFMTEMLDRIGAFSASKVREKIAALLKHAIFSTDDINELVFELGQEFLDLLIFSFVNLNEFHVRPTTVWCDFLRMTIHDWLVGSHTVDMEVALRDPSSVDYCAESARRCSTSVPTGVYGRAVHVAVKSFAAEHELPRGAVLPNVATVGSICDFSSAIRAFCSCASQLSSTLNVVRTFRYMDMSRILLLSTPVQPSVPREAREHTALAVAERIANSQTDESHARRLERLTEQIPGSPHPHEVEHDSSRDVFTSAAMAHQHRACNIRDIPLIEAAQMAFISGVMVALETEIRRQCDMLLARRGFTYITPLFSKMDAIASHNAAAAAGTQQQAWANQQ